MKKLKFANLLFITSFFILYSCKSAPSNDNILPEEDQMEEIQEENKTSTDAEENPESTKDNLEDSESEECNKEASELIIISRLIMDKGRQDANQMSEYFLSQNPNEDADHILQFAQMYIDESSVEGINWDVAFAQMCLETGYLRFGGLVQPEWHNYCGLGAMDAEHPGCIFETEQMGIRAHIQHLQAYGTTEDIALVNELIDPRYSWVHKTKFIEDIAGLTGTWATDPIYAEKLESILQRMETMINQ